MATFFRLGEYELGGGGGSVKCRHGRLVKAHVLKSTLLGLGARGFMDRAPTNEV